MRQMLGPGALGRPRGIGWRGRWEGGSGWRTHVNSWLIHVNLRQNSLQYCKVISLQLINEKKKKEKKMHIHGCALWPEEVSVKVDVAESLHVNKREGLILRRLS